MTIARTYKSSSFMVYSGASPVTVMATLAFGQTAVRITWRHDERFVDKGKIGNEANDGIRDGAQKWNCCNDREQRLRVAYGEWSAS